jgi:hypothetical protein
VTCSIIMGSLRMIFSYNSLFLSKERWLRGVLKVTIRNNNFIILNSLQNHHTDILNFLHQLTFKNRATYICDGRTAILQMFILYIFSTNKNTENFKHFVHSPFFSSKCRLSHYTNFFGSCIIQILPTGCTKI